MSLMSNIARGAVTTESGLVIGGLAEYCLRRNCGAILSSDGCSNQECPDARETPILQQGLFKQNREGCILWKK